jgi:hypothetical protein
MMCVTTLRGMREPSMQRHLLAVMKEEEARLAADLGMSPRDRFAGEVSQPIESATDACQ